MHTAYLVEPGWFELREGPQPEPGPDEALVRIAQTGICGTDLDILHGSYAADSLPIIPGHEFTGHVVCWGRNVVELTEGQPVVADMNIGCGRCYWCRWIDIRASGGADYAFDEIQDAIDSLADRPQDLKTQIVMHS